MDFTKLDKVVVEVQSTSIEILFQFKMNARKNLPLTFWLSPKICFTSKRLESCATRFEIRNEFSTLDRLVQLPYISIKFHFSQFKMLRGDQAKWNSWISAILFCGALYCFLVAVNKEETAQNVYNKVMWWHVTSLQSIMKVAHLGGPLSVSTK